ncbi:MAG TPA: S9 family peptidase [Thermoanaerobaculia bacterium]|jgi:dipeptidyl aminopeptidase/acylaminoacyl peptidase
MRPLFTLLLVLAVAPAAAADLADVDTYLGETVFDEVQVSPDGSRLAFITRRNDFERDREAFALWTLDLSRPAGSEAARPVRLADTGTYSALRWSPDGRLLSFLNAADGEAAQLSVLQPSSGAAPRRLTDPARFADGVDLYDWLPDGSGLIFVAAEPPEETADARRKRQEFYGDVRRRPGPAAKSSFFRVALADGKADRIDAMPFEVPAALAVSPDGWWLAALGYGTVGTVDTNEVLLLPLGPQAIGAQRTRNLIWEESLAWAGKDLFVAGPGEDKDGPYANTDGRLYRVEGYSRLARVSPGLEGYVKQMVPLADGSLLVTANVSTHMRVSRVEPGSGKVRTLLDQPGWIANLSASRDGGTIAFGTSDPRHFPEIYVAQGADGLAKARPVTDFNASFTRGPLPETETVSWDDGEGGTVEGVLFWPPGRKGAKGLPLVVDLHGGPFSVARTEAVSLQGSFLSFPPLLAARGFLVLNPNSRGSAGRGDAFAQGIAGRRCSRPSQDVILGVESLVARGWADRERLAIVGYSAGGGLSKCLIGRTDLFRAAVTGAGVWNDIALYSTRRGLMWAEAFQRSQPPWEDFARWWSESPASRLDRVKTPTLILAGERDGEAPSQAEELYRGLVARGVPAELLIFPGEGHVFSKPSHKRTKMRAEISWLEHYLLGKPRAELP